MAVINSRAVEKNSAVFALRPGDARLYFRAISNPVLSSLTTKCRTMSLLHKRKNVVYQNNLCRGASLDSDDYVTRDKLSSLSDSSRVARGKEEKSALIAKAKVPRAEILLCRTRRRRQTIGRRKGMRRSGRQKGNLTVAREGRGEREREEDG